MRGKTATVRTSRALKRRRIIERPRLFTLLDESAARVRMLVAPAGYGKTTLAEQWVRRDGRRAAWYTARRASTDVAALALDLARTATALLPGCDERIREHLRAVPNPGEHVDVLAEILAEEFASWSSDDWLVLDDYHELLGARAAERLVEELVSACPLQLLLASRVRPTWISGRKILYGDVLELNQTMLAMDSHEASEVLAGRTEPFASGLVALANGWPAVIALASVSSAEFDGEDEVPESLYRFFADEVFDALGGDVRTAIATLAIAPVLDRELASKLLGRETIEPLLSAALEVGILVERGQRLEIHPLARSFVEERGEHSGADVAHAAAVSTCLEYYRARRDWDAAFDVISRHGSTESLETLLRDALDDLLDTARLSTIEAWCELGTSRRLEAAVFSIGRAEVSLRQGRHAEAQTFAELAAARDSALTFRGLSLAGRAAHLASREEDALDLYKRAEVAASSEHERRDALWGQVMCSVELGLPEAAITLDELWKGVRISDPRDLVRACANKLRYQIGVGALDLSEADLAWELIDTVNDPLIESSFESVYSNVLSYAARYESAREVSSRLLSTVERYHLDFAWPYAFYAAAMAYSGLRQWREAERCAAAGITAAREGRNVHAEQIVFSVYVRLLAQQGRHEEALSLDPPPLSPSHPAALAEVECSRALAMAASGRTDVASAIVERWLGATDAVEAAVLLPAISAICALKVGDANAGARVAELERTAFATGALDLLVTAYRSAPELLVALLHGSQNTDEFVVLLRRVRDDDLSAATGHPLHVSDPRDRLSGREKEVFDLLCEGLTNKQIAGLLFISEGTVKVHAHHIYDKLGTRSRTALAVRAALERADQATSATEVSEGETGS